LDGSGTAKDEVKAVQLVRHSADDGCLWGIARWGRMLEAGKVVTKDEVAAARLYKIAADRGSAQGQWGYRLCLASGTGVAKDGLHVKVCDVPVSVGRWRCGLDNADLGGAGQSRTHG
jgi:TPR repeat protein